MKAIFWLGIMVLMQIPAEGTCISFMFQAVKNLSAHPTYLHVLGCFVNFLVILGTGICIFGDKMHISERIGKMFRK